MEKGMKQLNDGQIMAKDVFTDYGFRHISHIDNSVALGLVNESAYLREVKSDNLKRMEQGTIVHLDNRWGFRTNFDRLWVYKHDRYHWLAEAPEVKCADDQTGRHNYECRNCGRVTG